MPYKPTGKPNGRPPLDPDKRALWLIKQRMNEVTVEPKKRKRARDSWRILAERQNPAPFIQSFDSRGRPRHKPSQSRRIA